MRFLSVILELLAGETAMPEAQETSLFMQLLLSGIAFGSIYAMVAVGFNIIYNATGIINLAQGEFVMLGGMLTVWGMESLKLPAPAACLLAVVMVAEYFSPDLR